MLREQALEFYNVMLKQGTWVQLVMVPYRSSASRILTAIAKWRPSTRATQRSSDQGVRDPAPASADA